MSSSTVAKQFHHLGDSLSLIDLGLEEIIVHAPRLHLLWKGDSLHAATLTCRLDPGIYALVVDQGDFNLSEAVQEAQDGPAFDGDAPVELEAKLHPGLLPQLGELAAPLAAPPDPQPGTSVETGAGALDLFQGLAEEQPDHPLIQTSGWLATQVSQNSPRGSSRYRTLWDRLKITRDTPEKFERGEFNPVLRDFMRSKIGMDFDLLPDTFTPQAAEDLISQVTEQVTQSLQDLFQALPVALAADLLEEEGIFLGLDEDESETLTGNTPLAQVESFLAADGWQWEAAPGGQILHTGFTGEHGRFACHILWEPEHEYLVCYALIPAETLPTYLTPMTDYLNRANYGLPAGSFEIHPSGGEIRFRNSLFVGDRRLTYDEIEDLIYTVAYQADYYFPGILQVNRGIAPATAIARIEASA